MLTARPVAENDAIGALLRERSAVGGMKARVNRGDGALSCGGYDRHGAAARGGQHARTSGR